MSFGQELPIATLRDDVEALARRFMQRYDVYANTYEGHGTSSSTTTGDSSRQDRSVDFWDPRGRGWAIALDTGDKIFRRLLNRQTPPNFQYIIWKGRIHYPDGTSKFYPDTADPHWNHVHVTFV